MDWLMNILNSLGLWIDSMLYSFISYLYQVFIAISKANLFTETTLRTIIDRVFIILGIVMLFYIAYEILMLVVNPDKATGENHAKLLVSKFITAIVIIILLPTIFKYMHLFQTNILSSNIIGNVVLGSSTGAASDNSLQSAGASMALSIGQAFYHPESNGVEYSYLDCVSAPDVSICETFIEVYDQALSIKKPGYFFANSSLKSQLNLNLWERITGQDRQMVYLPIISTIAAFLAIRMIVAFSLDIGIRVAKLGFLQLIAPIPIAQNITKKESITQTKWFKSLLETYLDIFMKLIVIYFSMFTISMVPEVISNLWYESGAGPIIQMLATVAIILGILQFAKDAPKLIKELFNVSDKNLDFNIKKRMEENTYAQRGAATVGGAGASLLSNAYNGYKNVKTAEDGDKLKAFGRGAGSTVGGLFAGGVRGFRNSDNITSWGQVGDNINRTRAESDEARTNRESRRIAAQNLGKEKFTDAFGNPSPGSSIFGRAAIGGDHVAEFGKRSMNWLRGAISSEKLKAATAGKQAFENFFDPFIGKDEIVKGIKSARDEQISDLFSENKVNRDVLDMFKTDKNNKDKIDGLSDDQIISKYQFEISKIIESQTREKLKKQTISLLENEKNKQLALDLAIDLGESLNKSFNVLGTETTTKILKDSGFSSAKDMEKAFELIGTEKFSEKYDNLIKVRSAVNAEVKKQNREFAKEKSKDKK